MLFVGLEVAAAAELAVDGWADVGGGGEAEGGDGNEEGSGELHDCWTVGGGGVWMVFRLLRFER